MADIFWVASHTPVEVAQLVAGYLHSFRSIAYLNKAWRTAVRGLADLLYERFLHSTIHKWLRPCDVVTQLTRDHPETVGKKINTRFIDLLPAVTKSSFKTIRLDPKSLQVPPRACYLWNVRIIDRRRRRMVGNNGEVTGIRLWAVGVPGVKVELPRFHPFSEQAGQKGLGKNIKDKTSFGRYYGGAKRHVCVPFYPCFHEQAKPIAAGAAQGAEAAAAPVAAEDAEAAAPVAAGGAEAAAPVGAGVAEAAAPLAADWAS